MARRRLPRSFPAHELHALLHACVRERDRLILQVGFQCGLRVSEIVGLDVPDLDWERGQLLVRRGKGDKDRTVPVPSKLLTALGTYLAGRTRGPLFPSPRGGHLTTRAVQKLMKRLAIRAGLPDAARPYRTNPHKLRHTAATRWLRSGADIIEVRDLLGHASVATTQGYLSADSSRLKAAVERAAESA